MNMLTNKQWWNCAITRAIKTMCQTAIALIGSNAVGILEVDWVAVLSASSLAGIVSILTSLGGLPEVEDVGTEARGLEAVIETEASENYIGEKWGEVVEDELNNL